VLSLNLRVVTQNSTYQAKLLVYVLKFDNEIFLILFERDVHAKLCDHTDNELCEVTRYEIRQEWIKKYFP